MSTKPTFCVACGNKEIHGILKCEGCLQTFCLKHTNEHRQNLTGQLNEIISEHENLSRTSNENQQQSSVVFEQINRWEKDAIEKIQQEAEQRRREIQRLAQVEKEETKARFNEMTNELNSAREHQEYLERDLFRWKLLLEQFKYNFSALSPTILLQEDRNQTLVHRLLISKANQQSILDEKLTSSSNVIQFDDTHQTAMHCGLQRAPAYVYGTQEYASGQHEIRLLMSKKSWEFVLSFNIMSKAMELASDSFQSEFLTYGWQSDDCINPSKYLPKNEKVTQDFKGKTRFHVKFLIDCEKQMISYFNEKTKCTREIKVNIERCPLPWKLYFYVYDVGDTIRLLSSSRLS